MANTANLAALSIAEVDALYPAPNTTLTTDFSVAPYYDDYEKTKQYYRILYRPGYAVQARELTQSQTLLQKQISRFGQHIFKEGSIVLPGEFSIETDVDYIKIKDVDSSNNEVTVTDFINYDLSSNTGVSAHVIEAEDGLASAANTKTLYIRYKSGSASNTQQKLFKTSETLSSNVGTVVTLDSSAVGKGSRFIIREGVVYAKEHFIWFPTQSIILSRYGTNPSCRVGFTILEEIVRYTDDTSLLDPALESSNYSAPGADRLKLTCKLTLRDFDDTEGAPDFVELFTIKDGIVTELFQRPQYNILRDELAKRTLDESGDYYVKGLTVRVRENLDVNNNGGYAANGSNTLLSVGVEPGVAYVKGYEVNKLVTDYITVEKPINDYSNVKSAAGTVTMGNYIVCDEHMGNFTHDVGGTVFLRDRLNRQLSNAVYLSTTVGNIIGTAKVKSIEYNNGILGTPKGQIAVYLSDIRMNGTNSFANVRSLTATNFCADVVLNNGNATLIDSGSDVLLYYTGAIATRRVTDTDGNPAMDYDFRKTVTGRTVTSGSLTYTATLATGEELTFGSSTLPNSDKRELLVTVESDATVETQASVANASANLLTGNSQSFFTTRWQVGDKILISNNTRPYRITSVVSATQVYIDGILPAANNGNLISKVYKAGDVIDLTTPGVAAGAIRTVSASPSTLTFNFQEDLSTTISITHPVNVSQAQQGKKTIKANCFVAIDCSQANSGGLTGPYSLGFPDVFRIRKVVRRTDGVIPTGLGDTSATDVTSQFTLDTGQRDSYYDISSITPKTQLSTADSRLLVSFDYFEPNFVDGRGYFSIDSYKTIINDSNTYDANTQIKTETIPVYISPTSKQRYDLRNYLDFRPLKSNTAVYTTTPGSATVNPANTSGFNYISTSKSLRLPMPSTRFNYDYSYYLPRRDLIVIDREGIVSVIKGAATSAPVTPQIPPNTMALASVYVPPYPSIAPNYAQIINRPDLACIVKKLAIVRYTMRDIGVLKDRIVNLEYYASLNALQNDAAQMAILDEFGLNRFKNGIFVDDFKDHTFGDTLNEDYRIIVDPQEKSIRPIYTMNSFYYDYLSDQSSDVQVSGNLLTLPYTEELLLEQGVVTSFRNVELSSYRFIGSVYCDPDIDVWVDTNYLADNQITIGPSANNMPQTQTTWNEWQTKVTGYIVEPSPIQSNRNVTYIDPAKLAGYTTSTKPANLISSPNSPRDQRVVQTTQSSRTGTQTTYSYEENSVSFGDKVVDVSVIPYIRPQTIDVNVKGMKAYTKVYVFFDGERVDQYCAPMTVNEYIKTPEQRTGNTAYARGNCTWDPTTKKYICSGANAPTVGTYWEPQYGGDIVTDDTGEAFFALTLPADGSKQFRIGQKEIVVTDSPTNSVDATTYAKGYFYAQGLVQQKQETILTTRSITSNVTPLFEKSTNKKVVGYIDNPSCTAYSFKVKAAEGEEGLFLTSVDVFFARKHPTLGVWFEIRAMDNAGGITRTQVPLTEIWLTADQIKVSTNGIDNPTNVKFPSPIFLYNNTEYAFVMHTVGLNPEAYVWISRLGETDVNTGKKHNARPLTGTFYTTNNNMNWNIVDDIDLRIKFYRAKFTVGTGTAVLGNRPIERLMANTDYVANTVLSDLGLVTPPVVETDIAAPIVIKYGESFYTQTLRFSSSAASFNVGDELIDLVSNVRSKIIKISDDDDHKCHLANPRALFVVNRNLQRNHSSNNANVGLTTAIQSITKGCAKARKHKTHSFKCNTGTNLTHVYRTGKETFIDLEVTITKQFSNGTTVTVEPFGDSSYSFKPGAYAISSLTNTVVDIIDVRNYRYSLVDFEPTYISFKKTEIDFEMKPTANTGALQNWHRIIDGKNYYYDTEMALFSRSNELVSGTLVGDRSNKVRITMTTYSDYLSPVFDLAKARSIYVDNLTNANTDATANTFQSYPLECTSSGGELVNKYISAPVTLAEGQDAEDILVMLTAYKPPTTDVLVFVKILNAEDSDTLAQRPWIPLEKQAEAFSSLSDRDNFREFTFRFPSSYLTGPETDNSPGGEVQYTNSSGVKFTGYKYFQVKIALAAPNSAVIPRVADLRVIALQI